MADGNITVTVISRPPTPPGWSDTDWLRHLESCLPIGYAVRDTLYGTSKAGVLRLCSSTEAGAFAIYAAPQQRKQLTPRELELIDGMIEVQLHHADQCDRIANRVMADRQKGWDMERVELLRKLREHGIKETP